MEANTSKSLDLEIDTENKQNFCHNGVFYLYGAIDETVPQSIIAPLVATIEHKSKQRNPSPIAFHINSPGGDANLTISIINLFELAKKCGVPVHTVVMSEASSGGALIAMAGHKRFVSESAQFLFHFARMWRFSHNPEMADRNAQAEKFMQSECVRLIKRYTKIKDIDKKMIADNYYVLGGKSLKKLGVADEII